MREGPVGCLVFVAERAGIAETLASLLEEQGFYVTQAVEPDECLDLLRRHPELLLIIDASAEIHGSFRVLSQARQICPDVPVLVLVKQGDTETAVQAMKGGAADCLEMPIEADRLLPAIAALCRHADHEPDGLRARLTRVERIVLRHVLDGRTTRQIADLLSRSPRTIEVHRKHILKKLGATNLIELVKQARHVGLGDSIAGRSDAESATAWPSL